MLNAARNTEQEHLHCARLTSLGGANYARCAKARPPKCIEPRYNSRGRHYIVTRISIHLLHIKLHQTRVCDYRVCDCAVISRS